MKNTDIVVGYDGSSHSDLALDWAVAQAQQTQAGLQIALVQSLPGGGGLTPTGGLGWETWGAPPEQPVDLPQVDRARDVLGADRVTVDLSTGSAAGRLVDASASASLVVVGSHGRGYLVSGLVGSTAYAVAAHAHCPVAVIRAPKDAAAAVRPDADHPVVVAVDPSERQQRVLDEAARLAEQGGAQLVAVRVTPAPPVEEYAFLVGAVNEVDRDLVREDEGLLSQAVEQVRAAHPGLDVVARHDSGVVGEVLASYADSAGLIVVGSRGRGGFKGLLLGSVSRSLIHLADCPVLVVH